MEANSSSSSIHFQMCTDVTTGTTIALSFIITNLFLLLPLCLLILFLGYRRWRRHRLSPTSSHSDIFTYHFAAMELIFAAGVILYYSGQHFGLLWLMKLGSYATSTLYTAQMFLGTLTCVERYLAVVHPVIYLRLRQSGGVRIRNISLGCVWLLYCGWIGLEAYYLPDQPFVPIFCFVGLSLVVESVCSLSVLCVLIRPGPREMGGNNGRLDQSKRRAFNTITIITGVQCLFFLALLVCLALHYLNQLSYRDRCVVLAIACWFGLPNSLVLPLLYLHRAGKLVCCHISSE